MATAPKRKRLSILDAALSLLAEGLWPVPIYPPGPKTRWIGDPGKQPIGKGWGATRPTEASLRRIFDDHPDASLGLLLGASGGVVDLEIDGETLDPDQIDHIHRTLLGAEFVTRGWSSRRGPHLLLRWDDRFARYGSIVKGSAVGLPGLELRIGARPGEPKQLQSLVPPSPTTSWNEDRSATLPGPPREWNGVREIAPPPDCLFEFLDRALAKPEPPPRPRPAPSKPGRRTDAEMAEDALGHVPASGLSYDEWIKVGMGLHQLGPEGLDVWDRWSAGDDRYQGRADLERHWRTFAEREGGVGLGTLFELAKRHGWEPRPSAAVNGSHRATTTQRPRNDRATRNGDEPPAPSRAIVRSSAMIESKEVEWLWADRIPLGMLTLFAGDPGLGKSCSTLGVAAAVSRGASILSTDRHPVPAGDVLLLSAEDDPARIIVPRLIAAGADRNRVHLMEGIRLADGAEAFPSIKDDLAIFEEALDALPEPRLVIIDPVSAYLGGVDDHRNSELRGLLSPLKALAERRRVAVLLVTHLTKGSGTNGTYRVVGSIAYIGACRAGYIFVRDKDDPARVLMMPNKFNVGPMPPGLAYRIADRGDGPAIEWESEPVTTTIEEALSAAAFDPAQKEEHREIDDWLRDFLSAGRQKAEDVIQAARRVGYSRDQLKRAKPRVGYVVQREGFGPEGVWYWTLPGAEGAF